MPPRRSATPKNHGTGQPDDGKRRDGHEENESRIHRRLEKVLVLGRYPSIYADIEGKDANNVNPDLRSLRYLKDR
jgi:hypothetical protein